MIDFIKIFIAVTVTALCFASQTFAATLDSVLITPAKDSFDIILNSDDSLNPQKSYTKDSLILTLKNTKPSNNFKMKYDTHNIDNIVIKTEKNNTKIIIKSKNINIPAKSVNYYWLLSICGLFLLRRKKEQTRSEFTVKERPVDNIDYILKNKIKKEEKIKIAA